VSVSELLHRSAHDSEFYSASLSIKVEEWTHTRLIMTLLLGSFLVVDGEEAGAVKTGEA
jgi:hypothetical protein